MQISLFSKDLKQIPLVIFPYDHYSSDQINFLLFLFFFLLSGFFQSDSTPVQNLTGKFVSYRNGYAGLGHGT